MPFKQRSSLVAAALVSITSCTSSPETTGTNSPGADVSTFLCGPAPEGTTVVTPLPEWQVGSTRVLEVRAWNGGAESGGATVTSVMLDVVEGQTQGVNLVWQSGETEVDAGDQPASEAAQYDEIFAKLPKLRFEYSLNQDRAWVGLTNADEVRASANTTLAVLQEIAGGTTGVEASFTQYDRMTDEEFGLAIADEPRQFHRFENLALRLGQDFEFETTLPNILGGDPFPAITTTRIVEIVDKDGCVSLEAVTIPDPDHFGPIRDASISLAFPEIEGDQLIALIDKFSVESRTTAQYDLDSTFLQQVTFSRTFTVGSETQVETRIITDVST